MRKRDPETVALSHFYALASWLTAGSRKGRKEGNAENRKGFVKYCRLL